MQTERADKLIEARNELNQLSLKLQSAFGVTVNVQTGLKIKRAWNAVGELRAALEAITAEELFS